MDAKCLESYDDIAKKSSWTRNRSLADHSGEQMYKAEWGYLSRSSGKINKGLTGVNNLVQEIGLKLLLLKIIETSIAKTFEIYPFKKRKMTCNPEKMQMASWSSF